MAYKNKIIRRLHRDQFAPQAWLERLEDAQQGSCYHGGSLQPLPIELDAILAGLQKALEQLEASIKFEKVLVFPLIRAAGETPLLAALRPHRQRTSALVEPLLHALRHLREQPDFLAPPREKEGCREEHWDATLRLVPALNSRLLRYLHAAETDYLPMADYLLGPSEGMEPVTGPQRLLSMSAPADRRGPFSA